MALVKHELCFLLHWFLGISEFQGLVGSFIGTVDSLAKLVEKEKMKVK